MGVINERDASRVSRDILATELGIKGKEVY